MTGSGILRRSFHIRVRPTNSLSFAAQRGEFRVVVATLTKEESSSTGLRRAYLQEPARSSVAPKNLSAVLDFNQFPVSADVVSGAVFFQRESA
jgi:hypothetical protein